MIIITWHFICDDDDCVSRDDIVTVSESLAREEAERRGWIRARHYRREGVYRWVDLCPFHAEREAPT